MKHFIIWVSSKGSKDLHTVVDNLAVAYYMRDRINKQIKECGLKARAYITSCEDGWIYNHKEIKPNPKK